ncbi:MAG: hypothetical protein LBF60_02985 [Treponema sp.]|nr:hypothetical protein [Treponema sp.]
MLSPSKYEKLLRYKYFSPWCKIINISLVVENSIHFDEISRHNDVTFSYLTGFYASKIKADGRALYCLTTRRSSLTYSRWTAAQRLEDIHVFGRYKKFLKDKNIKLSGETTYIRHVLYFFLHEHEKYKKAIKILIDTGCSKFYIAMNILRFVFQSIIGVPVRLIKISLKMLIKIIENGAAYTVNEILQKIEKIRRYGGL